MVLIRTGKILGDQVVVIDVDGFAREGEEIGTGGVPVGIPCGVSFNKFRKIAIAHTLTQVVHEESALEVNSVGIGAEGTVVVDGRVYVAAGFEVVDAELPPPTDIGARLGNCRKLSVRRSLTTSTPTTTR